MKILPAAVVTGIALFTFTSHAQVLLSKGSYTQNFDTLPDASGGKTNASWSNDKTLPGWYAASKAKGDYKNIRISDGESKVNGLYSFGSTNASKDRALGSIASSSPVVIAYGVRLKNDTDKPLDNFTVSYTGEQWRNSTPSGNEQALVVSYHTSASAITNPAPEATEGWTDVADLNFMRLQHSAGGAGLDGNAADNNKKYTDAPLTGLTLKPGEELFIRWVDTDDEGQNDHGLAIDDLTVSFKGGAAAETAAKP